jgi:hypothetical protein
LDDRLDKERPLLSAEKKALKMIPHSQDPADINM